ncbi:MAG: CpaD family pilus assembly protein [Pseudomonadota bacterium]
MKSASLFKSAGQSRSAIAARSTVAVTLGLAAVALAGCSMHDPRVDTRVAGWVMPDPSMRHPILVTDAPVFLELDAPRGATSLTYSQKAQLGSFVSDYRRDGAGLLTIGTPAGSKNRHAAQRMAQHVRHAVREMGVSNADIAVTPYHAQTHNAPLKISFTRSVAHAPECGKWPDNLANTERNNNYHNFGCAQQSNLAAMIENPRDLVEMRSSGRRDAGRRDVTWDKYVNGEITAAEDDTVKKTEDLGG